jgi:hypothetical protein
MTFSGPILIKVTPLRPEFNTERDAGMKLLIFMQIKINYFSARRKSLCP